MMDEISERVHAHPAIRDAKAILFDFDFTLADSSVGIVACVNYAMRKIGLTEAPPEDILKTVGLHIPQALVALRGEEYRSRGQEFFQHFTEKADEVMSDGTRLYPAAPKVIAHLNGLGYEVGIVSTKYRYRIENIMERDGLMGNLKVIVGYEDVSEPKPAPDGLVKAAGYLNMAIEDCVYVGDSHVDAGAAQSAGMTFVAVLSGTTAPEAFSGYPNAAVLPGVENLTSADESF